MIDGDDLFYFMGNGMTSDDLAMKGNFAPYMDLDAEFPELREVLQEQKKVTGIAPVNGLSDQKAEVIVVDEAVVPDAVPVAG